MAFRYWPCWLAGVVWSFAVPVHAQPDAERAQQRHQELLRQWQHEHLPETDARLQTAVPALQQRIPAETPCLAIRQVRVDSAGLPFDPDVLLGPQRDDPPEGRCLGAQGIALLVRRAQDALIDRGYITTRVAALSQDLREGVLLLSVLPGRMAQVRSAATQGAQPWQGPPLPARAGAVLDLRDLEQSLENLRRNPGAAATVQIVPAESDGHSDVVIDYQPPSPLQLQLSLDDAGQRDTGQWQAMLTLGWHNPLGLADQLILSQGQDVGGRSPGPRGSDQRVLHYSLPWGYWLFGLTLSESSQHQSLPGPWQLNHYNGFTRSDELSLRRVVHRSSIGKTSLGLKAFSRRSRNFINDTEVQGQRRRTGGWEAGVEHTRYLGNASVQATLNHRRGTGAFGAIPAYEEAFGEGSSRGRLTLASLALAVPVEWRGQHLQYQGQLRVQWDHTPLTPQDRLCLGGRYSVRGTDGVMSLCGDRGQLLRQTIAWTPTGRAFSLYAAFDAGRVSGRSAPPGAVLMGWGLGLRSGLTRGRCAADIDLFAGQPIRKPEGFETAGTTVGLNLNLSF